METVTLEKIRPLLPPRALDMHKGRAGRVLIVAGSPGMAGAAVIASGAALRCGAGLAYVSADEALWPIIQMREPCAVCVGRQVLGDADAYDAVAIGPGLGTWLDTELMVARALRDYGGPLVLDADALNVMGRARGGEGRGPEADPPGLCSDEEGQGPEADPPGPRPGGPASSGDDAVPAAGRDARREVVITPHPGEAARLLGVSTADVQADRRGAVLELARRYEAVAVLKGRRTLVAVPSRAAEPGIFENTTGNPGMATAGSGDALTGAIASFAAQGMSARDAALTGVFIHGLAGDLAAAERGEYGLVATDIVGALPLAIKRVMDGGRGAVAPEGRGAER
jgi:NAD(P)H-hydrate epimerase